MLNILFVLLISFGIVFFCSVGMVVCFCLLFSVLFFDSVFDRIVGMSCLVCILVLLLIVDMSFGVLIVLSRFLIVVFLLVLIGVVVVGVVGVEFDSVCVIVNVGISVVSRISCLNCFCIIIFFWKYEWLFVGCGVFCLWWLEFYLFFRFCCLMFCWFCFFFFWFW